MFIRAKKGVPIHLYRLERPLDVCRVSWAERKEQGVWCEHMAIGQIVHAMPLVPSCGRIEFRQYFLRIRCYARLFKMSRCVGTGKSIDRKSTRLNSSHSCAS